MHVVVASSAFDVAFPQANRHARTSATRRLRVAAQVVSLIAQGVAFAAVIWLLVAAPGFLSTQDSLVRIETSPRHQASR